MRTYLNLLALVMLVSFLPSAPLVGLTLCTSNLVLANTVFAGADEDDEDE